MENIAELIRKLLALAKSDNENEASLAMAKAQELLMKHNLDMSQIETKNSDEVDQSTLCNEPVDFDNSDDASQWERILISTIAHVNLCQTIKTNDGVHILGRRSNVSAVVSLYNWIEPQLLKFAKQSGYIRKQKSDYIVGMIATIRKLLEYNLISYQVNHNCTSLVVNLRSELASYYKQQFPNARSNNYRASTGAYSQGQSDGHRVSIYGNNSQLNTGRLCLR